jgi:hypothetical protein
MTEIEKKKDKEETVQKELFLNLGFLEGICKEQKKQR